jgi:uncharacterized protein YbjT (DUF2867 family)
VGGARQLRACRARRGIGSAIPPDGDALRVFPEPSRRIVLRSLRGGRAVGRARAEPVRRGLDHRAREPARPTFSELRVFSLVPRRPVALPASVVGASFGDVDGIAEVGDAVLTDAGHAGRIYEASEPRPLSFAGAVEELAAATGRSIRYLRVSTERDAALIAEQNVPEEVVVRLTRVLTELLDGRGRGLEPAAAARRDGVR